MLFGTIRDFETFANEFSKDSSPRPEGSCRKVGTNGVRLGSGSAPEARLWKPIVPSFVRGLEHHQVPSRREGTAVEVPREYAHAVKLQAMIGRCDGWMGRS